MFRRSRRAILGGVYGSPLFRAGPYAALVAAFSNSEIFSRNTGGGRGL
jgi:hypothetical protein